MNIVQTGTRQRKWDRAVAFLATLLWLVVAAASSFAQMHSLRATELETRLFAPCCYVQTLDVHESALADKLRAEIERRLGLGESPRDIEDDLAQRYGEQIRAVPRDADPRRQIPLIVGVALGIGLLALSSFALRWKRRQAREAESSPMDPKYDRELDAALREEDDDEPPRPHDT